MLVLLQMLAACNANDLPTEAVEVMGGGVMEWTQHRCVLSADQPKLRPDSAHTASVQDQPAVCATPL